MTKEKTPKRIISDLALKLLTLSARMSQERQSADELELEAFTLAYDTGAAYFSRPTVSETAITAKRESQLDRLAKANEAKAKSGNKGGRPKKVKP